MSTKDSKMSNQGGEKRIEGSFGQRFMSVAKSLQFVWFIGHVDVIISTLLYVLSSKGFFYRLAYFGVLESFGIIIYQQFFLKANAKEGQAKISNLLQNESIMYFALAMIWFLTPRFMATLIPFFLFSLFHALNYMKGTFCPTVMGLTQENSKLISLITKFVNDYNEKCMHWVGTTELGLLFLTFLRMIFWYQRSFIVFIFYALFVKIRYENSKYMKTAFAQWRVRLDGIFASPSVPQPLKLWYSKSKGGLVKLSNYHLTKPAVTPVDKKN